MYLDIYIPISVIYSLLLVYVPFTNDLRNDLQIKSLKSRPYTVSVQCSCIYSTDYFVSIFTYYLFRFKCIYIFHAMFCIAKCV